MSRIASNWKTLAALVLAIVLCTPEISRADSCGGTSGPPYNTVMLTVAQTICNKILDSTNTFQGTLSAPVFSGTITGTYTLAGTPTIAAPTITGLIDASAASAGQIKFPSTQNPSSNANTLDDYREGTWTPSIGGTATYNVQSGTYLKIGRMVTVSYYVDVATIGTGSTTTITGLPFNATANTNYNATAPCAWAFAATAITSCTALVQQSGTGIILNGMSANGNSLSVANAIFTNGARAYGSITYLAAN